MIFLLDSCDASGEMGKRKEREMKDCCCRELLTFFVFRPGSRSPGIGTSIDHDTATEWRKSGQRSSSSAIKHKSASSIAPQELHYLAAFTHINWYRMLDGCGVRCVSKLAACLWITLVELTWPRFQRGEYPQYSMLNTLISSFSPGKANWMNSKQICLLSPTSPSSPVGCSKGRQYLSRGTWGTCHPCRGSGYVPEVVKVVS